MKLDFENDFQKKVMIIRCLEPICITNVHDVLQFREAWVQGLSAWHSPYKALLDCTNLKIEPASTANLDDFKKSWERLSTYLKGFFLKSAFGFNGDEGAGHHFLPFPLLAEAEAREKVGLGRVRANLSLDFRASIVIQNHFQQHVMEVSFENEAFVKSPGEVLTLKSKILNNLMQWHSPWNLLIDCHQLEIAEDVFEDVQKSLHYFKSFFLKKAVGYHPKHPEALYPFQVFRSRHKAVAQLESEGLVSGNDAVCRSSK